jgi:hypothetical protein
MKLGWMQYIKLLFGGRKVVEEMMKQGYNVNAEVHKAGIKSASFWMAIVSGLGAVVAQAAGVIPPPYGQIAATISGLLYAIARGLTKKDDPLGGAKPAMATTEFWVNILAALSAVGGSVGGVTRPEVTAILASISAGAIAAADALAKSGAQPNGQPKP